MWAFEDESDVTDFHEKIPDPALTYPFELDDFQKRAVLHVHNDESVFVAAHTSAGKTVIAEYAIACAMLAGERCIYTSPIKALSNQKFRDFKNKFGSVGIITGDVRVDPEASCLIMTTEILRSMLYRRDELLDTVRWVIFDEVHYLNDSERGVVYEETIIMLPSRTSVVMLSATVPNYMQFAGWVGRTRGRPVYCVKTDWRPVPLKFHFYMNERVYPLSQPVESPVIALAGAQDTASAQPAKQQTAELYKFDLQSCKKCYEDAEVAKEKNKNKPRNADQRERIENQRLYHFLTKLWNEDLLPAAVFVFSRAKCEELANAMTSLDMLSQTEKSKVHLLFKKALAGVSDSDYLLPQIQGVMELASRGIGIHHGGLLPIMKEATEILFSRGHIKVLFATETFAMGINMPTRTVIFSSIRKHDGAKFRYLLPSEFTQMSGRAGRRGLDKVGSVFVFAATEDRLPDYQSFLEVMSKKTNELKSQFHLTFQMLLQLFRASELRIEDMLGRSFLENHRAASIPALKAKMSALKEEISRFGAFECSLGCHANAEELKSFVDQETEIRSLAAKLAPGLSKRKDLFKFGRLVRVYTEKFCASEPAVIIDQCSNVANTRKFQVRVLGDLPVTKTIDLEDISMFCDGVVIDTDSVSVEDDRFKIPCALGKLSLDDYENAGRLKDLLASHFYSRCSTCPLIKDHFSGFKEKFSIQKQINDLAAIVDETNMRLAPQRVAMEKVLTRLGFIEDGQLTFKGKAAVEILNASEITLVEIIFENVLSEELEIPTIVAIVSAFVAGNDGAPELDMRVAKRALSDTVVSKLNEVAKLHRGVVEKTLKEEQVEVDWSEFDKQVCFGMAAVAYEWAQGKQFSEIMADQDLVSPDGTDKRLQEGAIARTMVRTDELMRKIILGMNVIGNETLAKKLEAAREAIRRDIAFGMSLYLRGNNED